MKMENGMGMENDRTDINNRTNYLATKPHYEILDGLRGVAAVMVLVYHIFETHTIGTDKELIIGHGYLAVDFLFVLSGFVIGYAYDDRWGKMSFGAFLKRRIVRLHPMVVMGMILGAALFYFSASTIFSLVSDTPVWKMLLYLVLGVLLIPTPPSMDIRGWQEMHTLDAPCWSLFFEYIANILYGLFIRKFTKTTLSILVILFGCATLYLTLTNGDVSGGWTFDRHHLYIGFTRLLYPFFAGLLLYRVSKLIHVKRAFLWCSLLLTAVLLVPRIGDAAHVWMNGLYEALIIIAVFPLIVFMGAGGEVKGKYASKLCKFLGDISYPVYLVNYPIIYIYTAWVSDNQPSIADSWLQASLVFVSTIVLSYVILKLYDEPVRKWLKKKVLD
jgi:peptidoglycan/LPS O-acetylase OafA/YrhL